jgi:hypothetical protein
VVVLVGMGAMEFLGLLALGALRRLGYGHAPWALPDGLAFPVAFLLGLFATYAAGRVLGVLDAGDIDAYRERADTMQAMARSGRRVRAVPRSSRPSVVIEY